jgi:hypothetical protein
VEIFHRNASDKVVPYGRKMIKKFLQDKDIGFLVDERYKVLHELKGTC